MTEIETAAIPGTWNFRDVGGARTADGQTVRRGIVFRSAGLNALTAEGQAALAAHGITDVFDLRGVKEAERVGPDQLPETVRLHATPIEPQEDEDHALHEKPKLGSPELARAFMERAYSRFPVSRGAHAATADVIRAVADSDAVVLFHCAAGKDRTGWIAATLLRAAGVTDADVLADFLRSNDAVDALREWVISHFEDDAELSDEMLGVREDYYRVAMDIVDAEYGGFDGYLETIGINAQTLARLRARLLE